MLKHSKKRLIIPAEPSRKAIPMRQTVFRFAMCVSIFLLPGLTSVEAQQSNWVNFNDDRSRMNFNTADGEEKDIIAGDVDNDGDEDILIARKVPYSNPGARPNYLLINENGILVDRTADFIPTFASDPDDARDIQLFDANNDGWLDVVTVTTFSDVPRLYINRRIDQNGNWRGYSDIANWYSPPFPIGPRFCGVAIGDINADGFDDLLFIDYSNNLENRLLINDQDGTFTDETTSRLSSQAAEAGFGTSGFISDFNYDGFNDIVIGEAGLCKFLRNDGTGHFLNTNQIQTITSTAVYMIDKADFDNDGRDDVYIIDDGQDYIVYNDATVGGAGANGNVVTHTQLVTNSSFTTGFNGNLHPFDVDKDGWMDIAVCDVDVDIPGCSRTYTVLQNNNGILSNPNNALNGGNGLPWNVNGSMDMCWIDINCDGHQDMFVADCDTYYMFVNDAEIVLGDVNQDEVLDLLDVAPFVNLLSGGQGCTPLQADVNQDGLVNLLDVGPFVGLLSGK